MNDDGQAMKAFSKTLCRQDHTIRYSISMTPDGWEVREERDNRVVMQVRYQDWHRVERARASIATELRELQGEGWAETN